MKTTLAAMILALIASGAQAHMDYDAIDGAPEEKSGKMDYDAIDGAPEEKER